VFVSGSLIEPVEFFFNENAVRLELILPRLDSPSLLPSSNTSLFVSLNTVFKKVLANLEQLAYLLCEFSFAPLELVLFHGDRSEPELVN
jgi:hypothetical protein